MKNKGILIMTFVLMSFFSIAQSNPAPEDSPADFAQRGGPPPPPPASIDGFLVVFMVLSVLFAFVVFNNYKKSFQN
jgi:hypothetical protein